jgi:TATA-box binding protein (TBP) (component of TFIID and TFIIIB)
MAYTINNIKVSFKIELIPLDNVQERLFINKISFKIYHNYYVFKIGSYHCVLFKENFLNQNNHLNVTKILSLSEISDLHLLIEKVLKKKILQFRVDNIMATATIGHPLSLRYLSVNQLRGVAKFNCETFPGLFLKYKEGTLILFHSGKIVIVGCRCEKDIKWLLTKTIAAISMK